MRHLLAGLLAALSLSGSALAQEADSFPPSAPNGDRDRDRLGPLVPDFARLQTGGWMGAANVGIGYAVFDDVLHAGIGYGFTPERAAGHAVHNFDVTLNVRPLEIQIADLRLVPAYLGAGLMYLPGSEYEVRYPPRYRRISSRYYYPTALHWFALLGAEAGMHVDDPFFDRHALYYQVVGMDTFVVAYLENDRTLRVTDVLASTVGYRAAF